MTHKPNWPTRQEWEAGERRRAEHCISDGINAWDYGQSKLGYTDAERAEVESLAPEAIKAIRRACGRVERSLRQQFPRAGELAKGFYRWCERHGLDKNSMEAVDQYHAAIKELSEAETAAYWTLRRTDHVRSGLRVESCWREYGTFEAGWADNSAPSDPNTRYEWLNVNSPELDRLHEISEQAMQRTREHWEDHGRKVLADLDSGKAWEDQLAHMAWVEEWFANGPTITRIKA
jgi:hypothetical protein